MNNNFLHLLFRNAIVTLFICMFAGHTYCATQITVADNYSDYPSEINVDGYSVFVPADKKYVFHEDRKATNISLKNYIRGVLLRELFVDELTPLEDLKAQAVAAINVLVTKKEIKTMVVDGTEITGSWIKGSTNAQAFTNRPVSDTDTKFENLITAANIAVDNKKVIKLLGLSGNGLSDVIDASYFSKADKYTRYSNDYAPTDENKKKQWDEMWGYYPYARERLSLDNGTSHEAHSVGMSQVGAVELAKQGKK